MDDSKIAVKALKLKLLNKL